MLSLACNRGDDAATPPSDVAEATTEQASRTERAENETDAHESGDEIGDELSDEIGDEIGEAASTPTAVTARPAHGFACRAPAIPIPRPRECERGATYPECKWQMPAAPLSAGRYRRWRNTIVEHWWGRPALVTFILSSLDEYERLHPDQVVAVGDLDAPGPRHQTHDRGVDVDLYVLGALLTENAGGGRYPSNYEGKTDEEIEALRVRVLDLAKVLAACANGAVRIYYNDDVVLERFHAWYDAQGFAENPFGRPMQRHNSLHDFHFHVTIEEDLPVHPMEPLPEGTEHPTARIEAPPPPGSAPNLSSRTRRPGEWAAVPRE
ncbi:MAG: hypothetical protein H6721_32145 [Sandaracinus sp.]|nr:hypothetical protein [Sandaracinus sp.]MCB9617343.1 hypothetical protein [Sandaracinus sp.]MCB9636786.1 hypothetical protein [Sandaracinus sp.]